jgi:hypothetical protein
VPGTDIFWRMDGNVRTGRRGELESITYDGTPLPNPPIEVFAPPLLADPAGGVLVEVPGGVHQVTADSSTKVTGGRLLAVSATHAIVHECDELLACGYHLVDRATGGRAVIPVSEDLGPDPEPRRPNWPTVAPLLSPDGGALIIGFLDRSDPELYQEWLGVLDLVTGAFEVLVGMQNITPIAWSPDGSFVFYISGGRLLAFDRVAGDIFEVSGDVIGVDALALRSRPG